MKNRLQQPEAAIIMFLFKPKGSKNWHIGFWDSEKKKPRSKTTRTSDKTKAEKLLKKEEAKKTLHIEDETYIHPKDKRFTLSQAFEIFKSAKDIKPKTITAYKSAVDRFINICGDKLLYRYTKDDYLQFITRLNSTVIIRKGKEQTGVARNTKANYTIHLFSLFQWLIDNKYVKENIIKKINPVIKKPVPIPEKDLNNIYEKILDYHKFERKYVIQQRIQYYDFFLLKYLAAFRLDEAVNTCVEDYDFENDIFHVRNNKGDRVDQIPMVKDLKEFLLSKQLPESGKTFPSITYDSAKNFWQRLCKRHSINYGMHQIRKARGTDLANQGVDPLFLQEFMRHKNFSTTQQYYIRINIHKAGQNINSKLPLENSRTSIVSSIGFKHIQTRLAELNSKPQKRKAAKI